MKYILRIVFCFAVVLGIDAGLTTASEPALPFPQTPPQPASGNAPKLLMPPLPAVEAGNGAGSEPLHDPTAPSPIMRQVIGPPKAQGKTTLELPVVELKARIVGGNQGSVAVLQIDKRIVVVRQGSQIDLDGAHSGQKIRVIELNADEVRLEVQPLNRIVSIL
jgi:hypothetical protein